MVRGHGVTVYERDEAAGGLMRFGVPDFKLDKRVIDRRLALLEREGVEFRCGVDVGRDIDARALAAGADAVIVATGARVARELPLPGRELAEGRRCARIVDRALTPSPRPPVLGELGHAVSAPPRPR